MSLTRTFMATAGILLVVAGVGGSDISGLLPNGIQLSAIGIGITIAVIAIYR